MKASDVMVRHVVTVGPEASVADVAKILLQNCVSAVPVVTEGGKLVGIVSEGDVLQRPKPGTEARRWWWRDLFGHNNTLAAEFAQSHSRKVSDVMTREVVTARPDTPLGDIATLSTQHSIEWVPIVSCGKLIGIVSRANIVEMFARKEMPTGVERGEAARGNSPWARIGPANVSLEQGTASPVAGIAPGADRLEPPAR
jgi:CBS domain-containing protein